MTVTVYRLSDDKTQIYTCAPQEAVVAAYAQERGDWNTWDYQARYGDLVIESDNFVTCGDFTARKETR